MRRVVEISILLIVYLLGVAIGDLKVGSCGKTEYFIEKTSCDAQFLISMNASTQAFTDCPRLYEEAHDCFKKKILDRCFTADDLEKHNETVQFLEEEFGDEDHFCKEGLLISMVSLMKTVNISRCEDFGSLDYEESERQFRDAFREEFSKPKTNFTRLKLKFAAAKMNQFLVVQKCALPRTDDTYHFFDPAEFNPFDTEALERVNDFAEEIEKGNEVGPGDKTALTVVIVVVVILVILAGVFFFLWRRDKSRAEIRRQKRESRKAQETKEKNGDTEMQPLSGDAVVQTPDEVGSA